MKKKIIIISSIIAISIIGTIILCVNKTHATSKTQDIVVMDEDGTLRDAVTNKELSDEEIKELSDKGVIDIKDNKITINEDKNKQPVETNTTENNTSDTKNTSEDKNTNDSDNNNSKDTNTTTESKTETTTKKTTESTTEKTTEAKNNNTENKTTENNTTEQPFDELPDETFKPINHTHSWGNGEITTKPTCTKDGVKTYTCSCGKTKTETIKATGHNYKCEIVKGTCTKPGKKIYTCTNCKDTYTEETGTTDHAWGSTWEEEEVIGSPDDYRVEMHFYSDSGIDLTTTYGVHSDADVVNLINQGIEISGYYAKNLYIQNNDCIAIVYTKHKCNNCGTTETINTVKTVIYKAGQVH